MYGVVTFEETAKQPLQHEAPRRRRLPAV